MGETDYAVEISWASERHLRVCFGAADDAVARSRVHPALAAIREARVPGLADIIPAYSTLLLEFTAAGLNEERVLASVRRAVAEAGDSPAAPEAVIMNIPVCYDPSCAPDLAAVAKMHGIDAETVIRLHTEPTYRVQFIGFMPGFGYLTGLPPLLATPRLETPRVRVPAGSVGIAGDQTGIYPRESPGGWRLVGRTPLVLFDARRPRASLLAAGDRVRFVPISLAEFEGHARHQST